MNPVVRFRAEQGSCETAERESKGGWENVTQAPSAVAVSSGFEWESCRIWYSGLCSQLWG